MEKNQINQIGFFFAALVWSQIFAAQADISGILQMAEPIN